MTGAIQIIELASFTHRVCKYSSGGLTSAEKYSLGLIAKVGSFCQWVI